MSLLHVSTNTGDNILDNDTTQYNTLAYSAQFSIGRTECLLTNTYHRMQHASNSTNSTVHVPTGHSASGEGHETTQLNRHEWVCVDEEAAVEVDGVKFELSVVRAVDYRQHSNNRSGELYCLFIL